MKLNLVAVTFRLQTSLGSIFYLAHVIVYKKVHASSFPKTALKVFAGCGVGWVGVESNFSVQLWSKLKFCSRTQTFLGPS